MRNRLLLIASVSLLTLSAAAQASAHAVVGNRFFPATLSTDDPGVADELSLPTVSTFKSGDSPASRETDVAGEYSKRLTSQLGVSVAGAWTQVRTSGGPTAEGFQNLETTLKYQFVASAEHEAIVAAGVSYEWGGTGSEKLGVEHQSTLTPTLYFGKGGGDFPDFLAWARPFAVTGLVGYAIPTRSHTGGEANPKVLQYGVALEYSLPYLNSHVKDYGLPTFVNQLTPLIEASFETPLANTPDHRTTGTINPGVVWAGRRLQVGVEALIPINRDSGRGTGGILQVHYYLDDLFPRSIGKPIW